MNTPPPVIDVFNPGAVNTTYAQVAALQALGYGGDFFTSYYFKGDADALSILPAGFREKALRQLKRRQGPGIDPARVHNAPWLEALYVALARSGAPEAWCGKVLALRNRRFDRRMSEILARRRPDLVIGNDGSAEASFVRARELGIPTLLNQVIGHDAVGSAILTEEYRRDPDFAAGPPRASGEAAIETRRREALLAGGLLAPSDYVRETLIEVGVAPERIFLLPYGVDTARFRPPPVARDRAGPLRLLYVGRIEQRKGLRYLLEAMKAVPRGTAELTLVGNPLVPEAALAPYRELFRQLPNQPYHRIHEVFAEADAFVYPSLHEGSALAVYEALASGLPVISTRNAGSVVRDAKEGYLVPIRDSEALAERIGRLAGDENLRRRMAAAARARAETYTWARYAETLNGIVRTMLAGPKP